MQIENMDPTGLYSNITKDIAKYLNFTYTVKYPVDLEFGALKPDGSWSGLIGQLERKEVDFVISPLGMSLHRSSVMDFADQSYALTNYLGIYKMPKKPNALNMYLLPFSEWVWFLTVLSVLVTTVAHALMMMSIDETSKTFFFASKMNSTKYRFLNNLIDSFFFIFFNLSSPKLYNTESGKKRKSEIDHWNFLDSCCYLDNRVVRRYNLLSQRFD